MQFVFLLLGISLSIFGIGIIIDPIFYDSKHMIVHDFTGMEWPFGGLLLILGSGFIITPIRNILKRTENE